MITTIYILLIFATSSSVNAQSMKKILPNDGAAGHGFGRSVSIYQNTAVIGAYNDDDKGVASGSVYIFTMNDTTNEWTQTAKLVASDGAAWDSFGRSVSIYQNTAVIGAEGNDDKGSKTGSAYIFTFNDTTNEWTQTAKLVANDGAAGDWFGRSVSIYQNTAVIGAVYDDYKGSVYIFTFDDTTNEWAQTAKLVASDGTAWDFFGGSVSIYQNIAVIGAAVYSDEKGSVYIFTFNNTTNEWTQTAKLVASDGAVGDLFGISVSIYQNTAVIGAFWDDDDKGSVYIFTFDNTTNEWTQTAKLVASDGSAGDYFGISVSIYQNTAVIGAYGDDDKGGNSGSAYIFTMNDTTNEWTQRAKFVESDGAQDDYFGFSVSIYQDTAVIGAHKDDDKGSSSGSAYLLNIRNFASCQSVWDQSTEELLFNHAYTYLIQWEMTQCSFTASPTNNPSSAPSEPTNNPSSSPTKNPSSSPTNNPSSAPSEPAKNPSSSPTNNPRSAPSQPPTNNPSLSPPNSLNYFCFFVICIHLLVYLY